MSCLNNNCHVVNICRNYGHPATRRSTRSIVEGHNRTRKDAVCSLMFLNDNDGLEGEGEEAAGPLLIDLHGSDDPMPVQEGEGEEVDREDGSGDHQTESGQVYIY